MTTIKVALDFSREPGGRHASDGPFSGETFRGLLHRAFQKPGDVTVELDGVRGYGSSFLDEAFGGLIREGLVGYAEVKNRLVLVSERKYLLDEIRECIEDAKIYG